MKLPLLTTVKHSVRYRLKSSLGIQIKPRKLRIALSNRCNARCIMCDVWKPEYNHKQDLTLEEYEKIFVTNKDFFSEVRHVALTGGEPTLRKDLVDIAKLIDRSLTRTSMNINTNAFVTKRVVQVAEELIEAGLKPTLNISLDGMDEMHDYTRGIKHIHRSVHKTLQELFKLRDRTGQLKLNINHMVMEKTIHEAEKVYAFCKENRMKFNPIMPMTGEFYKNEDKEFNLSQEARDYLYDVFSKMIQNEKGRELAFLEVLDQVKDKPRDFRCWAGSILFIIEDDGDLFPNGGCLTKFRLGNLRENDYSFEKILASPQAKSVIEQVKTCRRCRLTCETLTTLKYPEGFTARRKLKNYFDNQMQNGNV